MGGFRVLIPLPLLQHAFLEGQHMPTVTYCRQTSIKVSLSMGGECARGLRSSRLGTVLKVRPQQRVVDKGDRLQLNRGNACTVMTGETPSARQVTGMPYTAGEAGPALAVADAPLPATRYKQSIC